MRVPAVTIVTPIHGRHEALPALLDTVRAQTRGDWELVIVDDASPEPVAPALDAALRAAGGDERVRLIRLVRNGGPGAARNAGIEARRGRVLALLDSDDAWAPTKLARQMEALAASPRPDMTLCACRTRVVHGGRRAEQVLPESGPAPDERWGAWLYGRNQFAQASSFVLGAALADRLRFEPSLRQYEDHLFFLDAGAAGADHVLVPEALSVWANDDRPGRMGAADDEARGRAFLEAALARGALDETEALAFELRCLMPQVAARSRPAALRLALDGARARGLPREAWVKALLGATLGPWGYERLRARLR